MSLQTNTEGSNEEFVAARVYNLLIAANASFLPNFLTSKSHRLCLGMRLGWVKKDGSCRLKLKNINSLICL